MQRKGERSLRSIKRPWRRVEVKRVAAAADLGRIVDQLSAEFRDRGRGEIERIVDDSWRLFERVALSPEARAVVAGWYARNRLCHLPR